MQQYSIKQLRYLLVNEKDLDIVKDYFFNWVKEHNQTALATRTKNKNIVKIASLGISDFFKKDIIIENATVFEVKGIHFTHGKGSFMRTGQAVFFYFTDLDWGMVMGITPSVSHISRFRMVVVQEKGSDFSMDGRDN
jgi:hypothetical protein